MFSTTRIWQVILAMMVWPIWIVSSRYATPGFFCGPDRDRELSATGRGSSITLSLNPGSSRDPCKMRIIAPETHVISLRLVAPPEPWRKVGGNGRGNLNQNGPHDKSFNGTKGCPFSVYLPEDRLSPVWRFDPCSSGVESLIGANRLLPPRLSLVWSPPEGAVGLHVVVTAVGQGKICKNVNQFACLRLGYEPLMCISDELVCDGIRHCPLGDSGENDESPQICEEKREKQVRSSWDKIAIAILKSIVSGRPTGQPGVATPGVLEMTPSPMPGEETLTAGIGLAQYGPWGYLLFGMLICGGILLICGLWECFCRKHKSYADTADVMDRTTALVEEPPPSAPIRPPQYEDLEQPPAYSVLFPPNKTRHIEGTTESSNA